MALAAGEARREQIDQQWRQQDTDDRERAEHQQHGAQNALAKASRGRQAVIILDAQPQRHECRIDRAVG